MTAKIIVAAAGILLVVAVNWYFLAAPKKGHPRPGRRP
jgi:hypothetical protein